jgi:SPP1 family predicted phage head-tail adaptor
MTRPGNMRHRITVQQIVANPTRDEAGAVDPTDAANWETYFECASEINTRGARQFRTAKMVTTEVTHFLRVRHSPETVAITDEMRILTDDGRELSVLAAYEADSFNHWIEIQAKEQV